MSSMTEDQILSALRPDALTPAQIAEKVIGVGSTKAALPLHRAFVLAVAAGFFIGLGATSMLVVKADTMLSFAVSQVLSGLVFSVGLFLVVSAGAELFTGNSLMIVGLLEKRYTPKDLLRAWACVYLGNLVGALLLALLLHAAGFASLGGGATGEAAVSVASAKVSLSPLTSFFRGVLCNVLVCLAVWVSFAARTLIDKLAACVMPVMAFVMCGYEHCVANMFFIPFGMLCQSNATITLGGCITNILFATLGNLVGGVVFVGCMYWFVYLKKTQVS